MLRHWCLEQQNKKPLVKWKDLLSGQWKGPDPLLTSGQGYACVFPQDTDSPIWIPDRLIRHVTVPQTPNLWRTYSLARRPPASSHLRATSHTPHPPHYTPRPRAKKVCAGSKGQKRERARGVPSRPTRPRRREENAPSPGSG